LLVAQHSLIAGDSAAAEPFVFLAARLIININYQFLDSLTRYTVYPYYLILRFLSRDDLDLSARDAQELGEEIHQLLIRFALDRRRGQSDSQSSIDLTSDAAARCAWLYPDRENHSGSCGSKRHY